MTRICKICEAAITDRTRSKRCVACRLPDPRLCMPRLQFVGEAR